MTPDSRYAFVALRGSKSLTASHLRMRKLVRTIEPAKGEPKSDFHGIGVCILEL